MKNLALPLIRRRTKTGESLITLGLKMGQVSVNRRQGYFGRALDAIGRSTTHGTSGALPQSGTDPSAFGERRIRWTFNPPAPEFDENKALGTVRVAQTASK
jgi:hypothetical protein